MDRSETIALWQRCEEFRAAAIAEGNSQEEAQDAAAAVWNEWANRMMSQREQLEANGLFQIGTTSRGEWHRLLPNTGLAALFPKNDETTEWHSKAAADFSGFSFEQECNFSGFKFPGETIFIHANFLKNALFEDAIFLHTINFMRATFTQNALFRRAIFKSLALFEVTKFANQLHLEGSRFEGEVWFSRSVFDGSAGFEGSSFSGGAHFFMCMFNSAAWFEKCTFKEFVIFSRAKFRFTANFAKCNFECVEIVSFRQTVFDEYSDFSDAFFKGGADFSASHIEKFFTMERTIFGEVPWFNQANFKEVPDFDNVSFPLPAFWRGHQKSSISAFRALRRIANEGHDHENEAKAFKGEIRSKRFTEHKPWNTVFWLGILYDAISDFGRSTTRPLLVWSIQIFLFGYFYFREGYYHGGAWLTCLQGGGDPLIQALLISIKNAFVAFASSRDPRIASAYECVYGTSSVTPSVPLRVTLVEMLVQVPLSAILIFLFLLAVRNQFKIK